MAGLSLLLRRGGLAPHPVLPDWVKFEDPEVEAILLANIPHAGEHLTIEEIQKVTTIGTWFNNNKTIKRFSEFRFFTSVTGLAGQALRNCTSLEVIHIPASVKNLYAYALLGCTLMKAIIFDCPTPPTLAANTMDNTNNAPIYVPNASVEAYKTASGWTSYSARIKPISEYNG